MKYELIILGGGPAGAAAAVYAARKKIKTLLITESFGGQSITANDIQNWIGEISISGDKLAKKFEEHVRFYKEVEIKKGEKAVKIEKREGGLAVETDKKNKFETRAIFLGIGARRKKLEVPGEKDFDGKGVAYCSTCDAPLFSGRKVAVVGGGNSGVEAVRDLIPYAERIYLLSRSGELKGDMLTVEKIKAADKVEIIKEVETVRIKGKDMVTGLDYKDLRNGEEKSLEVQGVFVEIGSIPNSEIVKDLLEINKKGEVVVDHKTQRTSFEGIWAAGDVTDSLYKQNNSSAGDAVKAVLNINEWLHNKSF